MTVKIIVKKNIQPLLSKANYIEILAGQDELLIIIEIRPAVKSINSWKHLYFHGIKICLQVKAQLSFWHMCDWLKPGTDITISRRSNAMRMLFTSPVNRTNLRWGQFYISPQLKENVASLWRKKAIYDNGHWFCRCYCGYTTLGPSWAVDI